MSEPVFGNLTPEEASRRGVEARQHKRAEQPPNLTPAQQIEAAMQKKAMAGDVSAAREYREWIKLNRATDVGGINGDILRLLNDEQREILGGWIKNAPDPKTGEPRPPARAELEEELERLWIDYCSVRGKLGLDPPWMVTAKLNFEEHTRLSPRLFEGGVLPGEGETREEAEER
jgi:hypothetical protein